MQAILSAPTVRSRRLRRRGQIGGAQLNSAFAPPQAGRTATMCCVKGDEAINKAKETPTSVRMKAADPSRQIRLCG